MNEKKVAQPLCTRTLITVFETEKKKHINTASWYSLEIHYT